MAEPREKVSFTKAQIESMKSAVCELEPVDEITSYTEVIEKLRPVIRKMKSKGVKLEQIYSLLREKFGLKCTIRTFKNCIFHPPTRKNAPETQAKPAVQAPAKPAAEAPAKAPVSKAVAPAAAPEPVKPAPVIRKPAAQPEQPSSDPGGFDLGQWDFSGSGS